MTGRLFSLAMMLLSLIPGARAQQVNHIGWTVASRLPAPSPGDEQLGVAGAFVGVHNNALLVAGGANFPEGMPWEGGKKAYRKEAYVWQQQHDWKQFSLPDGVAYGASATTAKGVVCIGGETAAGILREAFLLQWTNEKIAISALPALPFPLANACATAVGDVVYVAGGENEDMVSSALLCIDLGAAQPAWKLLAPMPAAISHAVIAAQSNGSYTSLYVIGGRARTATGISQLYQHTYCYDLKKNNWRQRAAVSDSAGSMGLSAASALPAGANGILVMGGDKGDVFNRIETYNAAIANASGAERDSLIAQKLPLLLQHEGFSREVKLYNTVTDSWTNLGELPESPVTTTAVKWNGDLFIVSGEIKPGRRSPDILRGVIDKPSYFTILDYTVLGCYFLLMIGIGIWTSRHQHTTADYFKGGEKIPGWATGLSIFGAKLSAITFIGMPAKAFATDWTYFFLLMTIIMCMPVVIKFFIPFYRRLGVTSSYEYLEKRFSYPVRSVSAAMYILLQLGRMGIVILVPAIALSVVTGIDVKISIVAMGVISLFYTVLGGIEAVIWTEVVQVIILLFGALLALVMIPLLLKSNVDEVATTLDTYNKLKLFDFTLSFNAATFWVVIIGGFSLNLIQYGADQTVVQRYLTTSDEKTAVKSLRLGAWLTLPSTIIFFAIGTLLFLYYKDYPQQVNIALDSQDTIFPWYIVTQLPKGVAGLVITAIFAAAMGSLNGSLNGVSTVFVNDFMKKLAPQRPDGFYLRAARVVTLIVGLFGTGVAYVMASWEAVSLWDQFNLILGLFTGSVGGLFVLGIFTERATAAGAVTGFVVSAIAQCLLLKFTDMNLLMYAFTGMVSCVAAGYLYSVLFPGSQHIKGLTIYSK